MLEQRRRIPAIHDGVVALIAPAGYGKSTLALALGQTPTRCVAPSSGQLDDFAHSVLEALSSEPAETATPTAALVELLTRESDIVRQALRVFSRKREASSTLILDNLELVVHDKHATAFVADLLSRRPPLSLVVLCSRVELPSDVMRYVANAKLGPQDLEFDEHDIATLMKMSVDDPVVAKVAELSNGWPIAVAVAARYVERGTGLPEPSVFTNLLAEQFLRSLDAPERDVAIAACTYHRPSISELAKLVETEPDRLRAIVRDNPFIRAVGSEVEAHSMLGGAVAEAFAERLAQFRDSAFHRLSKIEDPIRGAEIALALGNRSRAIQCLSDRSMTAMASDLRRTIAVLGAVGDDNLLKSPALWRQVIRLRRMLVPMEAIVSESRQIWYSLEADAKSELRTSLAIEVAFNLTHAGRSREAERVLDDARNMASSEDERERLDLLRTALDSKLGKYDAAQRALRASRSGGPNEWLRATLLDFVEATSTLRCGDYEAGIAMLQASARLSKDAEWSLNRLVTLSNVAFEAWLAADDTLYERAVSELRAEVIPSLARGWSFWLGAATGDRTATPTGHEPYSLLCVGYLFLAGFDQAGISAARLALQAADASDDLALRIFARIALAEIDGDASESWRAEIVRLAEQIDLVPFREAALAYGRRGETALPLRGILERFAKRGPRARPIRLDIIRSQVMVDGAVVEITPRERALLVLLAIRLRRLEKEAICDALWPDHDLSTAAKNLKVTVHRVRSKLGASALIAVDGGYCLGPAVETNVEEVWQPFPDASANGALDDASREALMRVLSDIGDRPGGDLSRFEWFIPVRHRLEDLRQAATLRLAQDAVARDELQSALALSQAVLARDAEDESALDLLELIFQRLNRGEEARLTRRRRGIDRLSHVSSEARGAEARVTGL